MTILDLTQLLAPLPGENPAGTDISYEPVVDDIKEARRADADYLSQGDWQSALKVADWSRVRVLATAALAERSKDLQLAAWLCEAVTHLHGFAGAAEGLALLTGLLDAYWDTLYPERDGDDLDDRVGRLVWLATNLPPALRELSLTGPVVQGRGYGFDRWQESRDVDNLARQDQERFQQALAEGKIGSEQWEAAVRQTPAAFYETLRAESTAALDAARVLIGRVDEKFGYDAPNLSAIGDTLGQINRLAIKLAGDKGVTPAGAATPGETPVAATGTGNPDPANTAAVAVAQNVRAGPPTTREEALRRLHEIAAFYRDSEPHSPVTYLVEKAARWGTMRLDEWIREVVEDDGTRRTLRTVLGYEEQ